jgi:hypothetical protein
MYEDSFFFLHENIVLLCLCNGDFETWETKHSIRFLNKYILLSKVVFQQNKSFYLFARTLEPNNE